MDISLQSEGRFENCKISPCEVEVDIFLQPEEEGRVEDYISLQS